MTPRQLAPLAHCSTHEDNLGDNDNPVIVISPRNNARFLCFPVHRFRADCRRVINRHRGEFSRELPSVTGFCFEFPATMIQRPVRRTLVPFLARVFATRILKFYPPRCNAATIPFGRFQSVSKIPQELLESRVLPVAGTRIAPEAKIDDSPTPPGEQRCSSRTGPKVEYFIRPVRSLLFILFFIPFLPSSIVPRRDRDRERKRDREREHTLDFRR